LHTKQFAALVLLSLASEIELDIKLIFSSVWMSDFLDVHWRSSSWMVKYRFMHYETEIFPVCIGVNILELRVAWRIIYLRSRAFDILSAWAVFDCKRHCSGFLFRQRVRKK